MAAQRETIFAKLFARLQAIADPDLAGGVLFRYATRMFEGWDEVAPSQCPAAQLRKGPETLIPGEFGMPPVWRLGAFIVIYCRNDEARDTPASVQLNNLITAVETMLQRQPTEGPVSTLFPNNPSRYWGTTLGGLCYSCQIAGTIEVFEGAIDQDSVAIIPLEILTTA